MAYSARAYTPGRSAELLAIADQPVEQETSEGVGKPSQAWRTMEAHWQLPRFLLGGTLAMRDARETYLPRNEAEEHAQYLDRLCRSFLYNHYSKTLSDLSALPFARAVQLSPQTPGEIAEIAQGVDSEGRSLTQFAHDVIYQGIHEGLTHILVDFPPKPPDGRSASDPARPYFVPVLASDVIAFRGGVYQQREVLTHLRIQQEERVPVGRFEEKTVHRVRVYDAEPDGRAATYETWERDEGKSQYVLTERGDLSIGVIPLVTFYTRRTGFKMGLPALEDLAWTNLAHWQSYSEQRNLLSFARRAILFAAGFTEEDMKLEQAIGGRAIRSSSPDARLMWVEHTGQAIGAGRNDLEDLRLQMIELGLRPLIAQPRVSATAAAIDSAQAHSTLQSWSRNLEKVLDDALRLAARWLELEGAGIQTDVHENFDFASAEAQHIDALIRMRHDREISRTSFWFEMKRRGIVSEAFDFEEEARRLEAESEAPETTSEPSM